MNAEKNYHENEVCRYYDARVNMKYYSGNTRLPHSRLLKKKTTSEGDN